MIFMPIYEGNLQVLMLHALDFVHTRDPPIIHRDIKPPNILFRGNNFFLTDFGIAKVVNTSKTIIGTKWYIAPEVLEGGKQTPKVDIWGLGVTLVECLVTLPPEGERAINLKREHWYEYLQRCLHQHQHAYSFAPMVAVDADSRPTARDLLNMEDALSDATMARSGPLSLTNQIHEPPMIHSEVLTPMDWTQTVATAFFQAIPQPTPFNESMQPNPVVVPLRDTPAGPSAQPRARRGVSGRSVKSTDERWKRHKRNGSSQSRSQAPSQPGRVSKRILNRRRRTSSKSTHKAQDKNI
jgi:serine/threonine protein kinase